MLKRHQLLLSKNYEFLVMEIPMDPTLEAFKSKKVLTAHDYEQLRTLRHQGRRALARYLLAVLPVRGSRAFQALLESLQEANAQHLVDLLVAQSGADNVDQLVKPQPRGEESTDAAGATGSPGTPSDTPLPPGPDPHEYAVRLARNNKLIREFVDPSSISPVLAQNKVISSREADMVLHLSGKSKKWDLMLSAILQRGERAFEAFMAALLQKGYSTMFHTIKETPTVASDTDPEPDQADYDTEDEDVIDKSGNTKASQTYPVTLEEADEELNGEPEAPMKTRNRNVADADTQTRRPKSEAALPKGLNDLQNAVPKSNDQSSLPRSPKRSDSKNLNKTGDNISEDDGQFPNGQNDGRPVTSNSIQNDDGQPSSTKGSPTKNGSPSKGQRRQSSLKSLQEEDENTYA